MIKDLLSEIALKCGDENFQEFNKTEYLRALHRANRKVAKLYGIDNKIFEFTLSEYGSEKGDIILDIPDFKAAIDVYVNNERLYQVDGALQDHYQWAYYLHWIDGELRFNYIKGRVGAVGMDLTGLDITDVMSAGITERKSIAESERKDPNDQIIIRYYSIPDYETSKKGEFIIPSLYEEELISYAIIWMADLGIGKYPGGEMAEKWLRIARRYEKRKNEYDHYSSKDEEWIKIQPFKFP